MKTDCKKYLSIFLFSFLFYVPAFPQYIQQGVKLTADSSGFGFVAISADGNTAVIGEPGDNDKYGAAWIYIRSGNNWIQQAKLVGTDGIPTPGLGLGQGSSVAISADGNTVAIGGRYDNNRIGAVWVFTRTGNTWTQQGSKLVGTGYDDAVFVEQGVSVALSADGNTLLVGGAGDASGTGAAWVFTRSGGIWTQQGIKLVGAGSIGTSFQGGAVSLSADGNTAIIGGSWDDNKVGAAWVFTRSGGIWTQQGTKLIGTGATGQAYQGTSVSLSADGNTAASGGYFDNTGKGAVWIFTRSGNTWSQQGPKLVGSEMIGNPLFGRITDLTYHGDTLAIGGQSDDSNKGAAWVFTRSGTAWTQQGSKFRGSGAANPAYQGIVSLSDNGQYLLLGGTNDSSGRGAVWFFTDDPVGIESFAEAGITLYPNPVSEQFIIQFETPVKNASCIIRDLTGKELFSQPLSFEKNTIDVSGLAKSFYLVQVISSEKIMNRKILVQ